MTKLKIDGVEYDVRIVYGSLRRAFTIQEGPNSGTAITGRSIRDIVGTAYSYTVDIEPNFQNPADYDSLYEVLTAPTRSHSVVMPYGQTTITFDAEVYSGTDKLGANIGGYKRWNGMSVTFKAIAPQRGVV